MSDAEVERALSLLDPSASGGAPIAPVSPVDKEIEQALKLIETPPAGIQKPYSPAGTYTAKSDMTPQPTSAPSTTTQEPSLAGAIFDAPGKAAEATLRSLWAAPGVVWQGVKEGYNSPNLLVAPQVQNYLDRNSTPLGALSHLANTTTGVLGGAAGGLTRAGLGTIAATADALVPPNSGGSLGRDIAGMGEYELTRRAAGDRATPTGAPVAAEVPPANNLLTPEVKAKPPVEEQIRDRAYQLWEASGRPSGRDQEFWHQASQQIADAAPGEPNTLLGGMKLDKDSTPNADPNSPQTKKFVDMLPPWLHGAVARSVGHAAGASIGGATGGVVGAMLGGPVGAQVGAITSAMAGAYIGDALREITAAYGPKVAGAIVQRMRIPLPGADTVAKTGALHDQEANQ